MIAKPMNKREALAAARLVVGEIARWGELGVDEYLPEWAQPSWNDFQDRVDALLDCWPNSPITSTTSTQSLKP
jgi:O-succinylbenzoate synthase